MINPELGTIEKILKEIASPSIGRLLNGISRMNTQPSPVGDSSWCTMRATSGLAAT